MKYTKPIVKSTNTNGITPKGSCIGRSCEGSFTCGSDGFKCNFGFSCESYK